MARPAIEGNRSVAMPLENRHQRLGIDPVIVNTANFTVDVTTETEMGIGAVRHFVNEIALRNQMTPIQGDSSRSCVFATEVVPLGDRREVLYDSGAFRCLHGLRHG